MTQIRILWHSDFYDGPLSGLAVLNGEKVWFHIANDPPHAPRVFGVYRLPPDLLDLQERWQSVFREKVGTHCDYDENGRTPGDCHRTNEAGFFIAWNEAKRQDPRLRMEPEFLKTLERVGTWTEGAGGFNDGTLTLHDVAPPPLTLPRPSWLTPDVEAAFAALDVAQTAADKAEATIRRALRNAGVATAADAAAALNTAVEFFGTRSSGPGLAAACMQARAAVTSRRRNGVW